MGITVSWDDETQTIIRLDYTNPWNWTDFQNALMQINTMAEQIEGRFDIINDINQTDVPDGAMGPFKRTLRYGSDDAGLIVIANASTYGKSIVSTFQKIYPAAGGNWQLAGSVDEARATIHADRKQQ